MPGLLASLRDTIFPPSAAEMDRRVRVQRNQVLLAKLEEQKAFHHRQASRIYTEHFDRFDYDALSSLGRRADDERPYLASGYLSDRRFGNSWPVLSTMADVQGYRGQARLLIDTNSFAGGFLDRLVDFVVGDGHTPECHLRGSKTGAVSTGVADADGDGRPDADPAVEACQQVLDDFRELNDWGCGAADREAEAYRRSERDGEVMLRFFKGGSDTNGLPRVRFVEPEQIDTPPNTVPEDRWGFRYEAEDAETLTAAYVRNLHDLGGSGKWVKAESWVWHKLGTDRSVIRGLSPFAVVAHAFEQAEKINDHLAEVAAIQAAIAYVRQHAEGIMPSQITSLIDNTTDGVEKGGRGRSDSYRRIRWHDGAGQIVDMTGGMQFEAGPASTGTPGYILALQSRLRQICARFGMPEFFTGDASNNNYASILVSGGPFEKSVKRRQRIFAEFQRAVYKRVLIYAAAGGRLDVGDVAAVDVRVTPPGVSIANPLEEAQIYQIENQAGVLSVQTWMAKTGKDPALEMANKEAWDAKFGVVGPDGEPTGDDESDPFDGLGDDDGDESDTKESLTTEAIHVAGFSENALREWTEEEYQTLAEADRSHLVFDRTKHRWVNPNKVVKQHPAASAAHDALKKTGRGEVLDWNRDPKTGKTELLVKRPDGRREILTADEVADEIKTHGVAKQAKTNKLPWAKKSLDEVRAELPKDKKRLTVQHIAKALSDLGVGEVDWKASGYKMGKGMTYTVRKITGKTVKVTSDQIRALLYSPKKKGQPARESAGGGPEQRPFEESFDPSKHPRDHGKFADKPGGDAAPKSAKGHVKAVTDLVYAARERLSEAPEYAKLASAVEDAMHKPLTPERLGRLADAAKEAAAANPSDPQSHAVLAPVARRLHLAAKQAAPVVQAATERAGAVAGAVKKATAGSGEKLTDAFAPARGAVPALDRAHDRLVELTGREVTPKTAGKVAKEIDTAAELFGQLAGVYRSELTPAQNTAVSRAGMVLTELRNRLAAARRAARKEPAT